MFWIHIAYFFYQMVFHHIFKPCIRNINLVCIYASDISCSCKYLEESLIFRIKFLNVHEITPFVSAILDKNILF